MVMDDSNSAAVRVATKIKDALVSAGFDRIAKFTIRKGQSDLRPFRITFTKVGDFMGGNDPEWSPKVELYESDAYGNDRDEVFLHVWNGIGMSCRAPELAAVLTRAGFPARVTTHRGSKGIRVRVP